MGFVERDPCPACGSRGGESILSIPLREEPAKTYLERYYRKLDWSVLEGGRFEAVGCRTCGCVYQRSVPDDAVLAAVYGRWLIPEDPREMVERIPAVERHPVHSKAAHELRALSRQLRFDLEGAHILDYGFGWGEWLEVARALGAHAYGTELGEARRAHGESLGIHVLPDDAAIESLRFDVIRAEQVFEHLPDPVAVLGRLAASLQPGGALFVSVPRDDGIASKLRDPSCWRGADASDLSIHGMGPAPIVALQPLEHLNCFTPASLQRLARRVGLIPAPLGTLHRYAFLAHPLELVGAGPRRAAKALARPLFERLRRDNQSCLMIRPG